MKENIVKKVINLIKLKSGKIYMKNNKGLRVFNLSLTKTEFDMIIWVKFIHPS